MYIIVSMMMEFEVKSFITDFYIIICSWLRKKSCFVIMIHTYVHSYMKKNFQLQGSHKLLQDHKKCAMKWCTLKMLLMEERSL